MLSELTSKWALSLRVPPTARYAFFSDKSLYLPRLAVIPHTDEHLGNFRALFIPRRSFTRAAVAPPLHACSEAAPRAARRVSHSPAPRFSQSIWCIADAFSQVMFLHSAASTNVPRLNRYHAAIWCPMPGARRSFPGDLHRRHYSLHLSGLQICQSNACFSQILLVFKAPRGAPLFRISTISTLTAKVELGKLY